jgi:surface protein
MNNDSLRVAVLEYLSNIDLATKKYGPIEGWDVSSVTDMSNLFYCAREFNGDIGLWNTGNVTNMNNMFHGAVRFNRDISGWNVGNVRDMGLMFYGALSFNCDLTDWNIGNGTHMFCAFVGAKKFSSHNFPGHRSDPVRSDSGVEVTEKAMDLDLDLMEMEAMDS